MKPKVLFFITSEFPYGTGETFIENEITFLAESFDKVVIVPLSKSSKEHRPVPSNVIVELLPSQSMNWPSVLCQISNQADVLREFICNAISNPLKNKILLKSVQRGLMISACLKDLSKKYKIYKHYYYSYWLDDGAIGISLLNQSGIRVPEHIDGTFTQKNICIVYLPLRKFLIRKLDAIFSISDHGKIYIENKINVFDKVKVSRLGTKNKIHLKKIAECRFLNVISISNVIPVKRVDLIGKSIQLLNGNKMYWHHFGNGVLIEQMQKSFPFAKFHGRINNTEIKRNLHKYSLHSILINTSESEGIPVSMMEAMSFGIPCIGTDVGGVSEIIDDGVNGFLMPANPSPQIVAGYISKYSNLTAEEKNQMRLNAYKTWQAKFNAETNYKAFIREIESLTR